MGEFYSYAKDVFFNLPIPTHMYLKLLLLDLLYSLVLCLFGELGNIYFAMAKLEMKKFTRKNRREQTPQPKTRGMLVVFLL